MTFLRSFSRLSSIALLAILVALASSTAKAQTITVASLAQDLAVATTTDGVADLVADARDAGLTDEQIANAFGRASVVTDNPGVLSSGYNSFVASSSVPTTTLSSSYSTGETTAQNQGLGGGGSGGGDGGTFNPPSGGSGGGGGSSNE